MRDSMLGIVFFSLCSVHCLNHPILLPSAILRESHGSQCLVALFQSIPMRGALAIISSHEVVVTSEMPLKISLELFRHR